MPKSTDRTPLLRSQHLKSASTLAGLLIGSLFSTQAISNTAVGYIAGELDVSGGAANYSIPIAVPPGRAGMEPLLSFNYSNQSGNGLLGIGWNLSGISLVHRCGSTLIQDGKNRQVKLNSSDNYCIDGQRLIPINGANGADGTEYRTEIDGFSKIVSYGSAGNGPAKFKVWTKSGQIMEFGYTDDSRIEAQGKSTVLNYAVNKISDTSADGNSILFSYTEITANSEFVPNTITYGPNHQNKVQFTYSTVSDLPATKLEGSNIKTSKRLRKVETFTGTQAVQNWTFTFAAQTDRPDKLTSIKLCEAGDNCLPTTNIGWSKFKPITNSKAHKEYIDFNGDGVSDELVRKTGSINFGAYFDLQVKINGTSLKTWKSRVTGVCDGMMCKYPELFTGDINGDGKTDVVTELGDIYISTGSSFSHKGRHVLATSQETWQFGDIKELHLNDFNGDGYSDLLRIFGPDKYQGIAYGKSSGVFGSSWSKSGSSIPYDGDSCSTYMGGVCVVDGNPSCHVADINNDQSKDFKCTNGKIYLGSKEGFSYFSSVSAYQNHADTQLDMVTSITNNTTTNLSYASILDSSVYPNQNESNSYPEKELRGTYLIKSVTSEDGIGGTRETTYQYGGAKINEIGRGNLGFAWIEETDQSTGTKVRTEFNQQFPYIGMVSKTETYLDDGTLVNKALSSYSHSTSHGGKVYFPYVTTSYEYSYERNGDLITTIQTENANFDSYGNLGWVKVTTTGGGESYSKTTTNTYANDTGQWHLGRLLTASVTHEHADGSTQVRNSAFEYDATTGFLTKEIVEPGTVMEVATTTTYDNYGNKTAVSTTAYGESAPRSANTMFDANGQFPISSSNALGHSDSKTTDPKYGVLLSQTGPNGLTTTWEYDGFGNQTKEMRADGTESTVHRYWASDSHCNHAPARTVYCVISQSDGSAPTHVYFDELNRKLRSVAIGFNGEAVYSDTVYNSKGQVEKVSRAYYYNAPQTYWATSTYDDMGRLIRAEEPGVNGTLSAIETTYNGLTTIATNSAGQQKTTVTNALGKVISVQEPEGASMSYQYDALGNLIKTTDSAGNVVTITYDLLGRKTAMDDPDMGIWSYSYNGYGELISQTDAKGQTSTMSYDVLGRMIQRVEPEGTTTWTYDTATKGIGKLAQVTGADGYRKTYTYDSLGRLLDATTEADSKVLTISTEYDQYSRLKKLVRPQGFVTENVYTAEGYLQAVRGLKGQIDDYSVRHLQGLLETAITDAQALQTEAYSLLTTANSYFAAVDQYSALVGNTTAASLPSLSGVSWTKGDSYAIYTDASGNQYIRVNDESTLSDRYILLHGDIITPIRLPEYYILKIDVNNNALTVAASSISNPDFESTLTASSDTLLLKDGNDNGVLEIGVFSGLSSDVQNNLAAVAGEVEEAAQLLAMDALQLIEASELLLSVAETAYREALLAGYWAPGSDDEYYNDYQSLIQDENYVTFWQAKERDAEGRLARELHGNGLSTVYNYDPSNGLLLDQETAFANFDKLRDLKYQYDQLNNVTQRADMVTQVEENFTYDALDRLVSSTVTSTDPSNAFTETKTYAYDALGNITHKSDLGNYVYDSARPHAVISAGGNTYSYDANGNMTGGAGRTLTWSSFNKPVTMAKDGKTVNFTYAPDRSRYLKQTSDGTKTLYLDKLYELITNGQSVTHKQFVYAGSSLVAVHVSGLDHNGSAIPVQTRYMHKDNLGSVDTITDGVGNVVDRMSFDPFGSRRQSNWREATVGMNLIPILTNRGFTGHEHIDEMDLIHMNGRVYDPMLGRFLSADPHIQSPYATQSYNRYSYVMNNPLKYSDPSGYFFKKLFKAAFKVFKAVRNVINKALRAISSVPIVGTIVQGAVCIYSGPVGCAAFTAATTYAVTGDLGMALKAGIVSYVGAELAGSVGESMPFETMPVLNVIGNGVVGGVMSKVQGGKFREGFLGSAFAASMKGLNFKWFPEKAQKVHRVITAGIIGGTASVLGGGKFANGAASAMFTQLYNFEATAEREDIWNRKAVRGTVQVIRRDGELKQVYYYKGEWRDAAPSNTDLSNLIPHKKVVQAVKALSLSFERVRNVEFGDQQTYRIWEHEMVYDLVNGEKTNVMVYSQGVDTGEVFNQRMNTNTHKEVEKQSCYMVFICQ